MCRCTVVVALLLAFTSPALAKSKYYVTKDEEGCQASEANEWLMEAAQENEVKIIGNGFETKQGAEKAVSDMKDCRTPK